MSLAAICTLRQSARTKHMPNTFAKECCLDATSSMLLLALSVCVFFVSASGFLFVLFRNLTQSSTFLSPRREHLYPLVPTFHQQNEGSNKLSLGSLRLARPSQIPFTRQPPNYHGAFTKAMTKAAAASNPSTIHHTGGGGGGGGVGWNGLNS